MHRKHGFILPALVLLGWTGTLAAAVRVPSSKIWLVDRAATAEKLTVQKGDFLRVTFEHVQKNNLVAEGGGAEPNQVDFVLNGEDGAGNNGTFARSSDYLILEAQSTSRALKATTPGATDERHKWVHEVTYFLRANRPVNSLKLIIRAVEDRKPYAVGSLDMEIAK